MKHIYIVLLVFLVFSCKNEQKLKALTADDIVTKSIEVSGGEQFERSVIRFNFRDKFYVARRDKGNFTLIRMFVEDKDSVFDLLSNSNFERSVNNKSVVLTDSIKSLYAASVNSVHYFSVLPYGLNDKAVNKNLIGEETINGKPYHKVKVSFNEDGGGEDFEDVFIYWIDKATFKVDYLAYSYNEGHGKGLRFRTANNERFVNGLRFVDYNNYKTDDDTLTLSDLGKAYAENKLQLLSKIELKNVAVEFINN